jgi:DNA invertase Pin-like site-specific DNA recombinase
MMAELVSDLIRARTKELVAVAKAKGRSTGRSPKLTPCQEALALALLDAGGRTMGEATDTSGASRGTLYDALDRRAARRSHATEVVLPRVGAQEDPL